MEISKYVRLPNKQLLSYLGRVREGSMTIVRTPFADKEDPKKVLANWMRTLHAEKLPPTLPEFEDDLAKKVGPMSWMLPLSDRLSDVDSYYDSILRESKPISDHAIDAVCDEWSELLSIREKTRSATVLDMKLSTNSGCPYFTRRSRVLNQSVAAYLKDDKWYYPDGAWHDAAVIGWRGQEGGPDVKDVKQRVVWMFPFAVNISELSVYQPLIEMAQKHHYVPAWLSNDAVDERITQLFDTKEKDDLVVCTDFSAFDQHFNKHMQEPALRLISASGVGSDWVENIFPIKYHIPLVLQRDLVRVGEHGMASGSGGTNADETIGHRALQHEAAETTGSKLNPNSMCLGDDGILTYPGISVEQVVKAYSAHGQEMNVSKQSASTTECVYLRRWHSSNYRINGICRGVYATSRALGRMLYQERFYDPKKWGPRAVAMRQLSILQNIEWHPLREKFARWCMQRDKFRLGLDIPGFLDNISSEFNKLKEDIPGLVGYNQERMDTGIDSWWIVKYLKGLS